MARSFSIIVACDVDGGIGIENRIPWKISRDLGMFRRLTTFGSKTSQTMPEVENVVIMGRNTWESLPAKVKPLQGRLNVVLSRSMYEVPEGVFLASSLDDAFRKLSKYGETGQVFIIGGASLYAQAINHPDCEKIFLTEVSGEYDCDAFFPVIPAGLFSRVSDSETKEENGIKYRFTVYKRVE